MDGLSEKPLEGGCILRWHDRAARESEWEKEVEVELVGRIMDAKNEVRSAVGISIQVAIA